MPCREFIEALMTGQALYKLPSQFMTEATLPMAGHALAGVRLPEMAASLPRKVILIGVLDLGRLNLDRWSLQTGDAGHFVHLDATLDEKGHGLPQERDCLVLAEDRRPAWSWRHL